MSRTVIGLVVLGVAVIAAALGFAWHSMQTEKAAISQPPAASEPATPPAATPLARFSRLAPWMIVVLVLAGTGLLALQSGSVAALWGSAYGVAMAATGAV